MLRTLVLALVLANGTYLAWAQGLLKVYGFAPTSQAEPQRLAQQIRPEAIQLLKAIPAPAPAPTAPLDAGPPAADTAVDSAQKPGASAGAGVLMATGGASAPESGASAAFAPAVALAAAPMLKSASAPAAARTSAPASAPASVPASAPSSARASAPAAAPTAARTSTATATAAPVAVPALVRIATAPPAPVTPAARQCLQAGLFTEQQASAMRARLQARLPAGSWSFVGSKEPVRWIVYMGRYVSKDALHKKRVLLNQAGVPFTAPLSPQLNPGLSLGSFKTKAQAEAALAKLSARGIRSARVVQERPELPTQWLRLPAADAPLQARAKALVLQLSAKRLQACS